MLAFSAEKSDSADCCHRSAAIAKWSYFLSTVKPAISDHWLCHSIALTYFESVSATLGEIDETGCGPGAFAAIAGIPREELKNYFPDQQEIPWTNRRRMEQALETIGWSFIKHDNSWPRVGLCLIHWCGPWTQRGYAHSILQHTHWVAVVAEYVFDVNWRGWLPKQNWEDIVVDELIRRHATAFDWKPLTCYELAIG